jgi:ketosteroid isomerase-like protein
LRSNGQSDGVIRTRVVQFISILRQEIRMPAGKRKESDKQALDRLNAEWGAAATRHDLDAVVAFYSAKGSLVWPGQKVAQGTRSIKRNWKGLIASLKWIRFTSRAIDVSGDLASDFGKVEMVVVDGKGNPQPKQTAKYLVVWRKERGKWKVLYDAYNDNGAPKSTPKKAAKKAAKKATKKSPRKSAK